MTPESTGEARAALAAFPGIADVTAIELDAGQAGQCLIAYVVPSGPGLDVPELRAHARKTLRNGSMPAAIMVVDEIPVTAVKAVALPVPELSGLLPYKAPATPRQEVLCELFAEVLGVARRGLGSDFFDLGGRSIEAMVLAGRISAVPGIRVSMADLFKAPTAGNTDRQLDQMADARKITGKGMADMTEPSLALDQESTWYPLSFTQEWFITLDQGDDGGTFGPRFMQVCPVRVTGHVDLAVLQGALDDVVARHELLRTLVVRDADPPHQMVLPPCRVPLEVRDLPPVTGKSRDLVVQELILEAEAGSISAREVPLMKVLLCKFDDHDSVLLLTVHHSVSDGWSVQVIFRDLGAFYAARRTGIAAVLPQMRQYREYAAWQRANATSTAEDGAPAYWQHKLDGAREFTMPNDHGHPDSYSRPYSQHVHDIEPEVMTAASALATATRSTLFTVMLSAFYILAHKLTGTTDLAIRAFTAGREELQFQNTMGLFLNCVPFRTDIADCTSFRDIVMATRETFVDAMAHELPVNVIEQTFPGFVKSREDLRTSQFIIANQQRHLGDDLTVAIAEGARWANDRMLQGSEVRDIPSGMVWNLSAQPSGELNGGVLFNLDEFDESTVAGWAAGLRRILAGAVREPDRDWRLLAGPASRHQNRV